MKHRAYLIGHRDDKVCFNIHPDDLTLFSYERQKYSPKDLLTIEMKKWKPMKTRQQLGLFFVCLDFYCEQAGYYTPDEKYWLRKGIEQTYSLKKNTGVFVNVIEQRVGIP